MLSSTVCETQGRVAISQTSIHIGLSYNSGRSEESETLLDWGRWWSKITSRHGALLLRLCKHALQVGHWETTICSQVRRDDVWHWRRAVQLEAGVMGRRCTDISSIARHACGDSRLSTFYYHRKMGVFLQEVSNLYKVDDATFDNLRSKQTLFVKYIDGCFPFNLKMLAKT